MVSDFSSHFSTKELPAFTLVEMLLTTVIISIIAVVGFSVYISFQDNNQVHVNANLVSTALRKAQSSARAAVNDSAWGIRLSAGQVVIFKGSSYAARDNAADIIYLLEGTSFSGLSEVVFTKFTGLPAQTGTITLQGRREIIQMQINAKGTLIF